MVMGWGFDGKVGVFRLGAERPTVLMMITLGFDPFLSSCGLQGRFTV